MMSGQMAGLAAGLMFLTLGVWLYLLLYAGVFFATSRHRRVQERLNEFVIQVPRGNHEHRQTSRVSYKAVDWLAQYVVQKLPRRGVDRLELRLVRAGSPHGMTARAWVAQELVTVSACVMVGLLYLMVVGVKPWYLVLPLATGLFGWFAPEVWLSKRITQRQARLRRQFPGMLDLLTVSVEAGLGFDLAMGKVAEESSSPMAQEVERMLREMQLGSPRFEALQRFAHRTAIDVIELFVSAVIQAERLGVGLTTVLRVQAEEARNKQRMEAQEKATKAPTKILFPLVLFIFPALFVVVLGPAALHIMQTFGLK